MLPDYLRQKFDELLSTEKSPLPILVEQASGFEDIYRILSGVAFPLRAASPYFLDEGGIVGFSDARVLVSLDILDVNKILPVLERIVESKDDFIIVAPAISDELLATLVVNQARKILRSVCLIPLEGVKDYPRLADYFCKAIGNTKLLTGPLRSKDLESLGSLKSVVPKASLLWSDKTGTFLTTPESNRFDGEGGLAISSKAIYYQVAGNWGEQIEKRMEQARVLASEISPIGNIFKRGQKP